MRTRLTVIIIFFITNLSLVVLDLSRVVGLSIVTKKDRTFKVIKKYKKKHLSPLEPLASIPI